MSTFALLNCLRKSNRVSKQQSMATIVKIIQDALPPLTPTNTIKLITYPREKRDDVVTSHLAFTHKDTISLRSLYGYWSFTIHQYTYFIVFTQMEKGKVILTVLLHQGDDQKESQSLFNQIAVTLRPLIRSGSIKLNKALLNEALLPTPLTPKELTTHLVNVMEKHTELYPEWHKVVQALLHSACSSGNREEVTKLLSKGGDLEEEDNLGKTPIHSAASEVSAEGMKWLMSIAGKKLKKRISTVDLIAHRTSGGKSPADVAVESNNDSALSHMMKVGGLGVVFGLPETVEKKSSDILHTAVKNDSCKSIRVLAEEKQSQLRKRQTTMYFSPVTPPSPISSEMDVSFDVVDDNGNTPLMLAVEKGYLNSCLYLLLGQADPNFPNPQNGNTSLHIAVANGHVTITKLLLVFKAIPTIANKKGRKPVDLASPAQRKQFQSIFEDVISSMERSKSQQSTTLPPPLQPDSVYLLSFDGGGVRGVITMQMLLAIQDRMKELDPMSLNPLYYFDYISATSIGSVAPLTTYYGNGTLETIFVSSLTELIQMIGGTSTPSKRTDSVVQYAITAFGADAVMADLKHPRIIITSALADRIPSELHLVTNYSETKERKAWEAMIMTTAAPFYMKPFEDKFLDGGLMVNNPTMDAIMEILRESDKEGKPANLGFVLSLGTGKSPVKYIKNVALEMPSFSFSSLKDIPSSISAAKNMVGIMMDELTKSDGEEIARAETICKAFGSSYYRMTPQLNTNVNIVESDMNKITDIMFDCFLYLQSEKEKIDQIARQLLKKPPNLQALFKSTTLAAKT